MIIIKTNNGDRFINEAETLQVSHIKDKAQVEVWPSRWGNQQQLPQYYIIEHVEQVIYTDHPHDVDWVDKGSELDRLSKEHSEHLKWSNELRGKYMELDTENAKLKDKVKELEKRIRTENTENRKIGTTKATIEMKSEEFESLLKAIDFGAEWMNENGYSVQEMKFRAIYDKLKEL